MGNATDLGGAGAGSITPREARQLMPVIAALMTCLFLAALDQTIVSTALPTIVGELGDVDHLSWVITAYLLTSTVSVPLFGKISDIYGRKAMLHTSMIIFVAGSAFSGMAQNMLMLIVARGIQGVGGGGLLAMSFTVIGDILTPRERSKYTGYFTAVFATASVVGPLLGGFFVDHLDWRWVFYVNLPLGALTFAVSAKYLHTPVPTTRRPVDLIGAAMLTIAVSCLLLAAVWGGSEYAWASPTIIALGAVGLFVGVAFIGQQRRAVDPILSLEMLGEPVFRVCIGLSALVGAVMLGASSFLPLYLQIVKGASATSSGLLLVPMMGALVLGANTCGRIVNATGRYKIFTVVGTALGVIGMATLATIGRDTSRLQITVGMGILGLGIGAAMPICTLAVQNMATPANMGVATAGVNFFRSLGSVFGVAVFGALMTTRLQSTISQRLPGEGLAQRDDLLSSPRAIRALPVEQFEAVAHGVTNGMHLVFLVALPMMVMAFALSFRLREEPLREDVTVTGAMVEGMEEAGTVRPNLAGT